MSGRASGSSTTACPSPTRAVERPYTTSRGPPLQAGRDLMKSMRAAMSSGLVRKGIQPEAKRAARSSAASESPPIQMGR